MSTDAVDIVRRLYDVWERDGLGLVPELMDPSIEWVNPAYAVEPGTRRGYDEFAAAVRSVHNIYPDFRLMALEFHDAGDSVAVRVRVVARAAVSDVTLDTERGYLLRVLNGRIVRYAWFNDPHEALEAVGLVQ
jgi:ketosteroid isomerase-like protein